MVLVATSLILPTFSLIAFSDNSIDFPPSNFSFFPETTITTNGEYNGQTYQTSMIVDGHAINNATGAAVPYQLRKFTNRHKYGNGSQVNSMERLVMTINGQKAVRFEYRWMDGIYGTFILSDELYSARGVGAQAEQIISATDAINAGNIGTDYAPNYISQMANLIMKTQVELKNPNDLSQGYKTRSITKMFNYWATDRGQYRQLSMSPGGSFAFIQYGEDISKNFSIKPIQQVGDWNVYYGEVYEPNGFTFKGFGLVFAKGAQTVIVDFPNVNEVTLDGISYAIKLVNRTVSLVAVGTNFTLTAAVTTGGGVVKDPSQISYDAGQNVVLTAVPNTAGYYFSNWSGDASGSANPLTVTMNSNKIIIANFKLNQAPVTNAGADQTITLPSSATLSGSVQDDGLPNNTLTYSWSKVSGPGTVTFGNSTQLSTAATFSVAGTYVLRLIGIDAGGLSSSDDMQVIVNPAPVIVYQLSAIASPSGSGTVTPSPFQVTFTYVAGTQVVLTAVPKAGYRFSSWTGDDNGFANPLTITMNSNKSFTANFKPIPTYTINASAGPNGSILPSGAVTVQSGSSQASP